MTARIVFFPVGNGDMSLIETDSGKKILIDCRIRSGDEFPDVNGMLRERLDRDAQNRLYIDLLVWSHPDEDHCQGIDECFHLGKPEDWSENKDLIFINEIWSSPIVYRRANNSDHKLCDAAKALNKEVKRRVNKYKDDKSMNAGNYVLILGDEDEEKIKDIPEIVLGVDEAVSKINGAVDGSFEGRLLGPSNKSDLDEDEEKLGKNHSSVIFNYKISADGSQAKFMTGGDAEVVCWEALLKRLKENSCESELEYDVLQAPHHCSWHSISHDSLKEKGDDAEPSEEALEALGKVKNGGFIISSSNEIKDDGNDLPAYRAMEEYKSIVNDRNGTFKCVDDHRKDGENIPLVIEIGGGGVKVVPATGFAKNDNASGSAVNRRGGDGYA